MNLFALGDWPSKCQQRLPPPATLCSIVRNGKAVVSTDPAKHDHTVVTWVCFNNPEKWTQKTRSKDNNENLEPWHTWTNSQLSHQRISNVPIKISKYVDMTNFTIKNRDHLASFPYLVGSETKTNYINHLKYGLVLKIRIRHHLNNTSNMHQKSPKMHFTVLHLLCKLGALCTSEIAGISHDGFHGKTRGQTWEIT